MAAPPSFLRPKTAGFHPNCRRLLHGTREFPGSVGYSSLSRGRRSMYCCSSAVKKKTENGAAAAAGVAQSEIPVRIVAVVGEGSVSPLKSTPWYDVMLHTARRLKWVDEGYEMVVYTDESCRAENAAAAMEKLHQANILMVVAVTHQESIKWIHSNSQDVANIVSFESSPASLTSKFGGYLVQNKFVVGSIFSKLPLPWPKSKKLKEVASSVSEAWNRHNSDDIRLCFLIIINAYIKPVPTLKKLRAKGFSTFKSMVRKCGPQIFNCLMDANCRKALRCLNECDPVDQASSYLCLASYESRRLEEFSLCVLQRHNCLELDAKIPEKPVVAPMVQFRGEELDHETAEDLLVGWLGRRGWSWRVVAGPNPAYGQFPCQHQLFYRGRARGSFWYEPVFQVRTLDGDLVWRRRKNRVMRGTKPGTFHFSALDNGVVSNEFWTIVDVSDDFSWGLFHFHGAARVAGQSYTGAVLVSPTGLYPDESQRQRLTSALDRCSIKEWEMINVDNCSCQNPPLGLPEGSRLHYKMKVESLEEDSLPSV
ncbi:violaxanthin de-epoxidase-like protein [Perilla frutescens var. hirtella]|uniref:Violaxanthin de-epoxidase-like protein n=1 Tax=Perilla frutescens var. hirtella TaxID=608512 RepID=A0AAD4JIF8_PERFH|nr:violaxanthin de-epoxidase-like protein [Perilla frutescens var. hirtella]